MRTKLFASVAFAALILPSAAFAQSTGSTDFEDEGEIVVTGTALSNSVGGVQLPDTPKSKVVIDSELIQRQRPGQTVNDIINLSPGVSFQNNDASGAAGGTFTIRGFDSTRISQTVDGIPLNDTGNYAIYSNQQQDPETLESVNVNLGTTDVDSPTASASGGTVNIRTRVPGEEMGALFSGMIGTYAADGSSAGKRMIMRGFAMLDTGDMTGVGTRAFVSASWTNADNPFNNYGQLQKAQWNARIYQTIGDNGDFIAISGHYNQNRNNFFGSGPLRIDTVQSPTNSAPRTAGTGSGNRFALTGPERFYTVPYPCNTDVAQTGVIDSTTVCGTEFDRRYNPSNTGNIRGNSRFTLAEGLVLTIDPSFQYVKANGGGTVLVREGRRTIGGTNYVGFIGGGYYGGRDLNGDGDAIDTCNTTGAACSSATFQGVNFLAPSQTQTRRYVVIAGLSYEINDDHRIRVGYTFDRGRHRQTGELVPLAVSGEPLDVFPVNAPILDSLGAVIQKRDRLSIAKLQKLSGEYRGKFGGLTVVLGVAVPFMTRDLTQNCFTTSAGGFVDCLSPTQIAAYAAANPYSFNTTTGAVTGFAAPQRRVYKYDKVLPSAGLTYDVTNALTFFASYSKGISAPGTDILYNAFYYPTTAEQAQPLPETTDSFDWGWRYRQGRLSVQLSGWYTAYKNRIATAYDPELDQTITRNLGDVTKYGVDGSIAYKPIPELLLYVFGSYLHSEIKDNVIGGRCTAAQVASTAYGCNTIGLGNQFNFLTAGKRESGAPVFTLGARVQGTIGPVDIGLQAKRTGARYSNDENLPIFQTAGTTNYQVYPDKAPAYTLVDLDVRVNMEQWGLDKTYIQFNVTNLFDKVYVGGFGGSANRFTLPFAQFGVPRAITGALVVGF
jgi:iron complex outermembrane receptor protein